MPPPQTILAASRATTQTQCIAWSYPMLIEDYSETVRQDPIQIRRCTYPFPILPPDKAPDCTKAVPILDIKITAGEFSKKQWPQDCQYAEHPDHFTAKPGFLLAPVVGEAMNRRIPNGWGGSRNFTFSPALRKATFPEGPH